MILNTHLFWISIFFADTCLMNYVLGDKLMCSLLGLQRESFTHKMRDGWGLATDGKVLFGSDGTSRLYELDPKSLQGYLLFSIFC